LPRAKKKKYIYNILLYENITVVQVLFLRIQIKKYIHIYLIIYVLRKYNAYIYFNISVIVLRTLKQRVLINNFNIKIMINKISKRSVLGTKKNFVKSLKLKELKPYLCETNSVAFKSNCLKPIILGPRHVYDNYL